MHILITGGAGFIGSHLVDLHLACGDQVHVVDDLSTGSRANLAAHEDNPELPFRRSRRPDLGPAGPRRAAGPTASTTWPPSSASTACWPNRPRCSRPTSPAANACCAPRATGGWKPQVVLASSSEVYGHNDEEILREDQDLVGQHPRRHALGLFGEQDRRRGAGPVLRAALRHPGGDRALLQHRRAAPGRTLRHGRARASSPQAVRNEPITVFGGGRRPVRSATCATPSSRSMRSPTARAATPSSPTSATTARSASWTLARTGDRARATAARPSARPLREAYGEEFEDIRRRRPSLDALALRSPVSNTATRWKTRSTTSSRSNAPPRRGTTMATAPWFVISPNALLSAIGLLRGPDKTVPTPAQDWRDGDGRRRHSGLQGRGQHHPLPGLAGAADAPAAQHHPGRRRQQGPDGAARARIRGAPRAEPDGHRARVVDRQDADDQAPGARVRLATSSSSSTATPSSSRPTTSRAACRSSTRASASPAPAARSCRCGRRTAHALAQTPEFQRLARRADLRRPACRSAALLHGLWWWITNIYREVPVPVPAALRLQGPDGVLRQHHEPGGLRGRLSPQVRRATCSTATSRSSATT